MSIEKGRAYFRQFGMEDRVIEFTVSSATVELAAKGPRRRGRAHRQDALLQNAGGRRAARPRRGGRAHRQPQVQGADSASSPRCPRPTRCSSSSATRWAASAPSASTTAWTSTWTRASSASTTVFPAVGSGNSAIELEPRRALALFQRQGVDRRLQAARGRRLSVILKQGRTPRGRALLNTVFAGDIFPGIFLF